jgi:dTDP-4-dehydrorhamnose 3,5-epimerase
MGAMKIEPTQIDGVLRVTLQPYSDERGWLARAFCDRELQAVLDGRAIRQVNHSCTRRTGALRGLHFQHPPSAEMKCIRALRGRVWDVAVDLRAGSPTFLQYHAEELSPDNLRMLVIPEGCAHGFQVLEPDSELLYLHTAPYNRAAEGGVRWNDPRLQIAWPLPPTDISPRDQAHPYVTDDFEGIAVSDPRDQRATHAPAHVHSGN